MSNYGSTDSNVNYRVERSGEQTIDHNQITADMKLHHSFSVFTPQTAGSLTPSRLKKANFKGHVFDPATFNSQLSDDMGGYEEDHLSLLDPYFDLTRSRLKRYYDQLDVDGDGLLSYDEFRACLGELGIQCQDESNFQLLVQKIDKDNSGAISFEEFESTVQTIKLADLFKPEVIFSLTDNGKRSQALLSVYDYAPHKIRVQRPVRNLQAFFYSKKPKWANVRWINVEGIDELNIKRLAVYFRLHPLSVEDILGPERHRPKFDSFDLHHFLILPVVISTNKTKISPNRKRLSTLNLEGGNPEEDPSINLSSVTPLSGFKLEVQQVSFFVLEDTVISIQEDSANIWGALRNRLEASYSKVRHNGAIFLVYSLLDAIVDDVAPIMNAFGESLASYETELMIKKIKFNIENVERLKSELHTFTRAVKPMREVVANLIRSDVIKDLPRMYFRDVLDHLIQILEDGEENLELCERLTTRYISLRADRQNDVMYHLTIVAALFIPPQFLTGVFGMNFQYMPEIHYQYSYPIFWAVVVTFFISLTSYFHFKKEWI